MFKTLTLVSDSLSRAGVHEEELIGNLYIMARSSLEPRNGFFQSAINTFLTKVKYV